MAWVFRSPTSAMTPSMLPRLHRRFLSETSTYLNESRGLTAGQYVCRFGGQFDADTSTSASRGVLLSPEPSTWGRMLIGFAGLRLRGVAAKAWGSSNIRIATGSVLGARWLSGSEPAKGRKLTTKRTKISGLRRDPGLGRAYRAQRAGEVCGELSAGRPECRPDRQRLAGCDGPASSGFAGHIRIKQSLRLFFGFFVSGASGVVIDKFSGIMTGQTTFGFGISTLANSSGGDGVGLDRTGQGFLFPKATSRAPAVGHIDLSQHIALFPWNVKRRLCLQLGLGRSRGFVHD
jgi:hypothetical protein